MSILHYKYDIVRSAANFLDCVAYDHDGRAPKKLIVGWATDVLETHVYKMDILNVALMAMGRSFEERPYKTPTCEAQLAVLVETIRRDHDWLLDVIEKLRGQRAAAKAQKEESNG